MSEPFKLNKASESFLDWIDGGGVPMPDTRYDTAMMLRKIEQKAGADADAQRREREAVLYRVIADSEADRLALRGALFAIFRAERWTDQDDFMPWLGRVLSDTAAAAQPHEAQVRADAVKPWRVALANLYAVAPLDGTPELTEALRAAEALMGERAVRLLAAKDDYPFDAAKASKGTE